MITLMSKKTQIWSELQSDYYKAIYWLKKQLGGDKLYDQACDRMNALAIQHRQNQLSDLIHYQSPRGNRWVTYLHARYYPEAHSSFVMPQAFCFYETIGSVGIFTPIFDTNPVKGMMYGCMVFTSHFFQRAAERLGFAYTSQECLAHFVNISSSYSLQVHPAVDGGMDAVDVRLSGAVGRGFVVSKDPLIFEIRTCLRDEQLSNKQKRVTQPLDEFDKLKVEPNPDVLMIQSILNPNEAVQTVMNSREAYRSSVGDTVLFDRMWIAQLLVYYYLKELGWSDLEYIQRQSEFYKLSYQLLFEFRDQLCGDLTCQEGKEVYCSYAKKFLKIARIPGYDKTVCTRLLVDRLKIIESEWDKWFKLKPNSLILDSPSTVR